MLRGVMNDGFVTWPSYEPHHLSLDYFVGSSVTRDPM